MEISIVKVGGSIALQPKKLRYLCKKLGALSKKYLLIVVPGGGEFADTVRQLDNRFHLSKASSHKMAILGMDQYGLLLADLIPNSTVAKGLDEATKALNSGKIPVFLPSSMLFTTDPLENSWDVTSDSIALYIASQLYANRVLLVTNVDGVCTSDPKQTKSSKLIEKMSSRELLAINQRTSVDKNLPKMFSQMPIDCFVVNGLFPNRIEAVLKKQKGIYTLISDNLH